MMATRHAAMWEVHRIAGCRVLVAVVLSLASCCGGQGRAAETDPVDFAAFLAERGIDRGSRQPIEAAAAWGAEQRREVIRVLLRLRAPRALWQGWERAAIGLDAAPIGVDDRLLEVRGRAVFVAPLAFTAEERTLAGSDGFDLVRVVPTAPTLAEGTVVDVLVPRAPLAWPRWRPIDEPARLVGLPLSVQAAPTPTGPPADGTAWPDAEPALLLAAPAIAFSPPTPLGGLGMNYALFDTVRDGGKLGAEDADAFYALLAAVASQPVDAAATPTDIIPIIDPSQQWFRSHRGDPVTISGVARQAIRIAVDDPVRRAEVGAGSYWELTVFVETPPLRVDGHDQQSYPVVCVVREVPDGMPTGDRITEAVTVSGFAMKRYGYPLADVAISSSQGDEQTHGRRMETALVVGRRAVWRRPPSGAPVWLPAVVLTAAAVALAVAVWLRGREARRAEVRAREALPDRIDLPSNDG